MSCKLAERGMLFNTGATLFVANKIDDYDREKAVKDSLEKLRQTLPMVGREQIITMSAKKVLNVFFSSSFSHKHFQIFGHVS